MVLNKGLESRWAEKVGGAKQRNVPITAKYANSRIYRETGFGLASAAKFGTGYFPSSGLGRVERTKPMNGIGNGSGSDMDVSSGSENEGGDPVKRPGFKEDELSETATSTEISYTVNSDGRHSSRLSSHMANYNQETTSKEDVVGKGFQTVKFSGTLHTPSAPPFLGSRAETIQYANSTPLSEDTTGFGIHNPSFRTTTGLEANGSIASNPVRLPAFQPRLASEQGTWCAVVSYDACVRLCLHAWALRGSSEVHCFLENECALLRDAFGLRHVLLQSEDELMEKRSAELVSQGPAQKSRKTSGKMKLQVRKVKIGTNTTPACSSLSILKSSVLKKESLQRQYFSLRAKLSSGWKSIRKVRLAPQVPANGSFSSRCLAYTKAVSRYTKQVSEVLKVGATNLCSSSLSYDQVAQESYSCLSKLRSSSDGDAVCVRPGSGEEHMFFPDGLGDYLVVDVQDSKGHLYGRVQVQVAAIADNPDEKLRWWPIYSDPEHESVGRVQLYINYTTSPSDHPKCGSVAETMAYDFLLEVAFKLQQFNQRNLILKDPWKWLVTEFSSYYGVSDVYTKLRYLSHIMDVATPTEYCLNLVYDLLSHVLIKGNGRNTLSHQEKRILGDVEDQIQDVLALVFENYKSLDESSPSGMIDVFRPASGLVAPALAPAIKLYTLLHDILSPEAQLKLCRYFQAATKKRLRRHVAETDEFIVPRGNEGTPIDLSTSYEKIRYLILNIRNEIFTDVEIHNQHVLPSFIEVPNISSSIYSVELSSRLRAFLVACPPPGPSGPVSQLVIAAADLQRDLPLWNVNPVNGGVDAKELFDSYITCWIQDKRLDLLEFCKQEKVKSCSVGSQHSTSPFIDEMFDRLEEAINEYQTILCHWPEYIAMLENAIADVEKATFEAVEKQFTDVISPLKDNLTNKIFGLKYVQKLSKGTVNIYLVPDELGVVLNSMRRLLDLRCPKIETLLKSWSSCFPDDGHSVIGEHLNDVKVMLRAKFRSYGQAIVEKLADNTRVQSSTKLKNIIRDSKEEELDLQNRMQPLKDLLVKTIHHLDTVVEPPVFIQICREFWERMGQDILHLLEDGKEKRSWYKGLRVAVSILNEIFASEMQNLRGNSLHGKDLELPGSMREIHSMLCKDAGLG
ncbi:pesticidal crystal cry8Ba protein [Parasponia andersonii]|uniref:Pesticidal crystal cry8Ba protein n=1 Tax=Parasponia andersonii TaxID=3476 RepID=A0A2P5AQK8_PARAD|nr:pesticidal crystal cry8Ba protein [Parasponia andersonii]